MLKPSELLVATSWLRERVRLLSENARRTHSAHESHIAQSFWVTLQPIYRLPREQSRLAVLCHRSRALACDLVEPTPAPVLPAANHECSTQLSTGHASSCRTTRKMYMLSRQHARPQQPYHAPATAVKVIVGALSVAARPSTASSRRLPTPNCLASGFTTMSCR